jgi:hypothetical protein
MSNAKIQMSNQAQNPNVKLLKAHPCPCARILERRVGIWALKFDIPLAFEL